MSIIRTVLGDIDPAELGVNGRPQEVDRTRATMRKRLK